MNNLVTVVVLLVLLAASAGVALYVWHQLGEVEMSLHGYIALGLGTLVSLALGGGLMFLVFYSSRRGHDDDVGH